MTQATELKEVERERDAALLEAKRFKDIIEARPLEDGKTVRVELGISDENSMYLVVTAPHHFNEESLGKEIGATVNAFLAVMFEKAKAEEPNDPNYLPPV